jgi:hypothetical protein
MSAPVRAEAALVADGQEFRQGIIARVPAGTAPVDAVNDKISICQMIEMNDTRVSHGRDLPRRPALPESSPSQAPADAAGIYGGKAARLASRHHLGLAGKAHLGDYRQPLAMPWSTGTCGCRECCHGR